MKIFVKRFINIVHENWKMAEQDQQREGIETDLYAEYDDTDETSNENHERYFENTEDGNYEYSVDENDFAAILDQKDKDLRLAAELGKALLEQNAELERRIEQTTEEYTQKLEVGELNANVTFYISSINKMRISN